MLKRADTKAAIGLKPSRLRSTRPVAAGLSPQRQRLQVVYGGQGRPVIGKVVASDKARKLDWKSGHHSLITKMPQNTAGGFRSQEELRAWYQRPEVKEAMAKRRNYAVEFSDDGSFVIEDVPPGTYSLSFYFTEGDECGMDRPIGKLSQEVTVPELPAGPSDEPLDLGTLVLAIRN